jgi:photosystem II stability/assembly factor-like uncharacterized protein
MTNAARTSLSSVVVLMILIAESTAGLAEVNHWSVYGPVGGSISTLAIDPQNRNILYAGTAGGVFKSIDGGANWRRGSNADVAVNSIVIDPGNSNNIYVSAFGKGIFKSSDAGMSWAPLSIRTAAGSLIQNGVFKIAIDTQKPATIYAGHSEGCGGQGCQDDRSEGLFKSTDGGATWQKMLLSSRSVQSLAVDPQQPNVLYVGTREGPYQTTDGGETWQRIIATDNSFGFSPFVAIDPKDARTVYIATAGGFYKTTNRGETWNSIYFHSYVIPPSGLLINPHDSRVLYVMTLEVTFKSTDGGTSWQEDTTLSTPLAWDPTDPDTIYVTRSELGESLLLKSTDGGSSWRQLYSGLVATTPSLAVDPQIADSVFAWTRYRLFGSTDGGRRWRLVSSTSLPDDFLDVAVDPQISGVLYASKRSGLYKSIDGGVSWHAADKGLPPNYTVRGLNIVSQDSRIIYAGVAVYVNGFWNGLFKSIDGGASWNAIDAPNLPQSRSILAFEVNPENTDNLYISFYNSIDVELFSSADAGVSWKKVAFPPTGPLTFLHLSFDPKNADVVYATAKCTLFKSTDRGANWTTISSHIDGCVNFARVQAEDTNTLYAATQTGLFKTMDGATSWVVESGVPRSVVMDVAIDRSSHRKYAVVSNAGVFATLEPGQEAPVPVLTYTSTGCTGQSWSLKVNSAQHNAVIRLFGNSNGKAWEVNEWAKTDAHGAYEATGSFAKEDMGHHILYLDVDGATSNDVIVDVSNCS